MKGLGKGVALFFAVLALAFLVSCLVVVGNDDESMGREVASHDCRDSQCYDQDYEYDYGNKGDNSQGRDRGSFSPGPFDDSPVDAFNNLCMPGATCYYDPPNEREPDEQREPQRRNA